jgi:hypothetical protein
VCHTLKERSIHMAIAESEQVLTAIGFNKPQEVRVSEG